MKITPAQIKALRDELGTQEEVSRKIGIGKRTLERAENDASYTRRLLVFRALRDLKREG